MSETISNPRIGVKLLGSGYAAILWVDVTDERGTYTDVQQTGIGRYKTREKAVVEAKQWAESDEYPLVEGINE